ncbi:ras association domain-containing protein 10 [Hoplias malabaricus]|uniref:ras association domain-containing protein 10 n=1 Tax=Hoplias malabaricus TaxID=27720 RepID=UPI0034621330
MEREENQISVWVCREEKLVSGLSKRTTCADVIKVLLEEQRSTPCAHSYCLVEKWRGSERALPHNTRLLRLWNAWGEERDNVRFVLVRSDVSAAGGEPRSAEARVVLSRESARASSTSASAAAVSRERQRRIVRKAFRKLERMNRRRARAAAKDARAAERMETLVHAVVSQDHTIRQQMRRLEELDAEIDRREARVHRDRVRAHGANYVQDTYLVGANCAQDTHLVGTKTVQDTQLVGANKDTHTVATKQDTNFVDTKQTTKLVGSEQDGGCEDVSAHSEEVLLALRLEEYADKCEEVLRLHEELAEREALAVSLVSQIEEELNRRWMERRCSKNTPGPEDSLLEEEQVRTELDTSLYIGLRLSTDLEEVRNQLDLSEEVWEERDRELRDLLEKVDSLDLEEDEEDEEEEACARIKDGDGIDMDSPVVPPAQSPSTWVEQARGLSKTCNSNDDDSDTGLSSMHSQDSDSAPVCESLV